MGQEIRQKIEKEIKRKSHFPTRETYPYCDNYVFPYLGNTYIPCDMCSPTWETHIPSDMCFPNRETQIPSDNYVFPYQGNTYPQWYVLP